MKKSSWKTVYAKYLKALEDENKIWKQRQGCQITEKQIEEIGMRRRKAAKDLIMFNK